MSMLFLSLCATATTRFAHAQLIRLAYAWARLFNGVICSISIMALPPLIDILATIPDQNRHRLDQKLKDRKSRTKIARSLGSNWRVVAQYIPNIQNDIDGIEYNNRHSLELQT